MLDNIEVTEFLFELMVKKTYTHLNITITIKVTELFVATH